MGKAAKATQQQNIKHVMGKALRMQVHNDPGRRLSFIQSKTLNAYDKQAKKEKEAREKEENAEETLRRKEEERKKQQEKVYNDEMEAAQRLIDVYLHEKRQPARELGDEDDAWNEVDSDDEYYEEDDSGEDYNAHIRIKLFSGKRYILRVRLYYSDRADETTVMMW